MSMRYFSFNEYDPENPRSNSTGGYIETWSEYDILKNYYPHWYKKMCEKYGQDHVDATYCFEDCLTDWVVVNWAWEVNSCPWDEWKPDREIT